MGKSAPAWEVAVGAGRKALRRKALRRKALGEPVMVRGDPGVTGFGGIPTAPPGRHSAVAAPIPRG